MGDNWGMMDWFGVWVHDLGSVRHLHSTAQHSTAMGVFFHPLHAPPLIWHLTPRHRHHHSPAITTSSLASSICLQFFLLFVLQFLYIHIVYGGAFVIVSLIAFGANSYGSSRCSYTGTIKMMFWFSRSSSDSLRLVKM